MMIAFIWDECNLVTITRNLTELTAAVRDEKSVWLNLSSPSDEEFGLLSALFKFHPLSVEDARHYSEVPKLDFFTDYIFITLHGTELGEDAKDLLIPELDLFLGERYLVTVEAEAITSTERLIAVYMENPELVLRGLDFVAHDVLDAMVDDYFPVLDRIEDVIDAIEERILSNQLSLIAQDISVVRRVLLTFRRTVSPGRDILSKISGRELPFISDKAGVFFRDIYDHALRAHELSETQREVLSTVYEVYLSAVSNRMNRVMQQLTAIATIFMPLTFIVGIYGMNFDVMPELHLTYGYFVLLAFMFAMGIWLYKYFKEKNWL